MASPYTAKFDAKIGSCGGARAAADLWNCRALSAGVPIRAVSDDLGCIDHTCPVARPALANLSRSRAPIAKRLDRA
jgi:hypothetical protein